MSVITFKSEKKISQAKNIQTTEYQFTYTPNVEASWGSTELTPDVDHQTVYRRERLLFDNGTYGSWGDAVVHARYVADGDPADLLALSVTSETYKRNLRLTGQYNPDICITVSLQGKYSRGDIAVTYGGANKLAVITRRELDGSTQVFNPPVSNISNVVDTERIYIAVPYDATDYESVLVTLFGYYGEDMFDEITRQINMDDVTQTNLFLGCVSALSELSQTVFLDGDYFVAKADIAATYTKGESYIYSNGTFIPIPTNGGYADKLLVCLHSLREDGSVDLRDINDPNTTSWFADIIASTITVDALTAIKAQILSAIIENAEINKLIVKEDGEFQGTVRNSQFETILRASGTKKYNGAKGPSTRTPGNASGNTHSADAYLGSDLKNNINARAVATLNSYMTTPFYSALGTICGYSNFNGLAYIDSVSSSKTHLADSSWANPFHCPVSVIVDYSPRVVNYSAHYTSYTYEWVYTGDQTGPFTSNMKPSRTGDYEPESWLDANDVGKTFWEPDIIYESGGTYTYYMRELECMAFEDSGTYTDTATGTVTVQKNGSTISVSSGQTVSLSYNDSISVTRNAPSLPAGATTISSSSGSSEITMRTADNFSTGIQFFTSSNTKGYRLSDLSSGYQSSNASLSVNSTTWITLTLSAASVWTYSSTYGDIYKLFNFAWTGTAPSASGIATEFVDTSLYPTYPTYAKVRARTDTNNKETATISSVSYTTTSLQWTASPSNTSGEVSSGTYLEYFDICVSIYDKPTGINAHSINPFDKTADTLGSSGNEWLRVHATKFIGALEGSVSGQVNTEATRLDNDKKVWGAVFN